MDDEFFRLIKDPEFCKKAEDESLMYEITARKLGVAENKYIVAVAKNDSIAMEQLQKEIGELSDQLKALR